MNTHTQVCYVSFFLSQEMPVIFKRYRAWLVNAFLSVAMLFAGSSALAAASFQFTYSGTTYDVSTMTGSGYLGFFANSEYQTSVNTGGYFMPWYGNQLAAEAFATAGYNSGVALFSSLVNDGKYGPLFIYAEPDGYNFAAWTGNNISSFSFRLVPDMVYAVATVAVPEIDGNLMPQALALIGASVLFLRRRRK